MRTTRVGCVVHARKRRRNGIQAQGILRRVIVAAGVLLLAILATPAWAGDGGSQEGKSLADRYEELEARLKKEKKGKDMSALQDCLAGLEALYEDARADDKDDQLCEKIVKCVGTLTRGSKDVPLATEMLQTLADIGDPRGARYVKPYLRQHDKKEAPEMLRVAIAVAADVRDDSLVKPLLSIVTDSKTYGVAASAVDALGRYRACRKYRNKIVDTLLKTTKKCKPGGQPRM